MKVDYEQDGLVYRSGLQKNPNVLSGEYYARSNTMYGVTPLILEYYLGNDTEVERVDFHQLSDKVIQSLRYNYTVPFVGNIYFYNYGPPKNLCKGRSLLPFSFLSFRPHRIFTPSFGLCFPALF